MLSDPFSQLGLSCTCTQCTTFLRPFPTPQPATFLLPRDLISLPTTPALTPALTPHSTAPPTPRLEPSPAFFSLAPRSANQTSASQHKPNLPFLTTSPAPGPRSVQLTSTQAKDEALHLARLASRSLWAHLSSPLDSSVPPLSAKTPGLRGCAAAGCASKVVPGFGRGACAGCQAAVRVAVEGMGVGMLDMGMGVGMDMYQFDTGEKQRGSELWMAGGRAMPLGVPVQKQKTAQCETGGDEKEAWKRKLRDGEEQGDDNKRGKGKETGKGKGEDHVDVNVETRFALPSNATCIPPPGPCLSSHTQPQLSRSTHNRLASPRRASSSSTSIAKSIPRPTTNSNSRPLPGPNPHHPVNPPLFALPNTSLAVQNYNNNNYTNYTNYTTTNTTPTTQYTKDFPALPAPTSTTLSASTTTTQSKSLKKSARYGKWDSRDFLVGG